MELLLACTARQAEKAPLAALGKTLLAKIRASGKLPELPPGTRDSIVCFNAQEVWVPGLRGSIQIEELPHGPVITHIESLRQSLLSEYDDFSGVVFWHE